MSKKMLLVFLSVAVGGFFLAHRWDDIRLALGVDEPSEMRAVNLAKTDFTLARHLPNSKVIEDLIEEARDEVEVIGWQGEQRTERIYLVKYLYRQNGKLGGFYFEVDVGRCTVANIEPYSSLAKKYDVQPSTPR